jgi:hypothetical protein
MTIRVPAAMSRCTRGQITPKSRWMRWTLARQMNATRPWGAEPVTLPDKIPPPGFGQGGVRSIPVLLSGSRLTGCGILHSLPVDQPSEVVFQEW